MTCSLFHFHICFTEWKFTIFHSFVTYIILNPFLHKIITLHFMFWHELYIPLTQKAKHYTPVPVWFFWRHICFGSEAIEKSGKGFPKKNVKDEREVIRKSQTFKAESSKVLQPNAIVYLCFLSRISSTQPTLFTWDKREWAKRANPCAPWILFEIYFKFAPLLLRLFLSVVFVTRPRGLLSRERDLFRHQTFEVWQPLQL